MLASAPTGIAAAELAERNSHYGFTVDPVELERWLLEQQFATFHDGRLYPTTRGVEVGGGIAWPLDSDGLLGSS